MKNKRLRPLSDRTIREHAGGFDWDVTRPLAEQWPWNGHETREAFAAHVAAGDAQIEALIEEVAKAPERALSEEQLAGIGAGRKL